MKRAELKRRTPMRSYTSGLRRGTRAKESDSRRRELEDMNHAELEALLDDEVSLYIRGTAALKAGSATIGCYTCRHSDHWKNMQAGHLINRGHRAVRWDVRQIRPQCPVCNETLEGNLERFEEKLAFEIGRATVDEMNSIAFSYGSRMPTPWLIEKIREWRAKNEVLRRELKCLG